MRITKGQRKTITIAEYLVPSNINWQEYITQPQNLELLGIGGATEDMGGVDYIKAFLDKTDKGIKPTQVKNLIELCKLLNGHRRVALQVTMWIEGFREGTLFLCDFDDEEDVIKELALTAYNKGKLSKFNYTKPLGFNQYVLDIGK